MNQGHGNHAYARRSQNQPISFADGPAVDSFGWQRVSQATTLFGTTQEYSPHPLLVENYTAGTATATHSTSTGSTVLSTVATTSGNRAMRQTKVYWQYQTGRAQLIKMTGRLSASGTPSGAAVARIGYFDDNNGVFFCRDATGYALVKRTNTSGSVVETRVAQSSWNIDKMDGTGPSGVTVDFTKEQIFVMDLQWLGVGRIRLGLNIGGVLRYVHEFDHANTTTVVYIRTACLPMRYEVFNSGGTGAIITMEAVCMAVESEGGVINEGGYQFTCGTKGVVSASLANSATLTPIMTLRLRDTFNGLTYRGHIHPGLLELLVKTNDIYYEWIWNVATLTSAGGATNELTGGTWVNAEATYSGLEFNLAATAYTGGTIVGGGQALSGTGSAKEATSTDGPAKLLLARTYANTRDTLTLAARGIGGAATAYATLNYEEQY